VNDLSDDARRTLLGLARAAIRARLSGVPAPVPPEDAALQVHSGAFVSLHARADGALRGCVGFVEPLFPLAEAVVKAAVAAATEDPRFAPVTAAELPGLLIDISVLGELQPIRADAVEVGVHGLVIRHHGASGLLLPQVPIEHGWDRALFLEHLCAKAGLPREAWRDPEAQLLGFTARVFREPVEGLGQGTSAAGR
jgi:AmmeMemoRadiSam system protein A